MGFVNNKAMQVLDFGDELQEQIIKSNSYHDTKGSHPCRFS